MADACFCGKFHLKRVIFLKRNTFTKADRLLKSEEYRILSKRGKRLYSDYLIFVYRKNQFSRSRLGITVSKKVGKAVNRNRIKRIIREYFRLNRCILPGWLDINIIAKKAIGKIEAEKIRLDLFLVFNKLAGKVEAEND